jgi:ABC-type uncharacterized transport system fused permease/ATPase subunit
MFNNFFNELMEKDKKNIIKTLGVFYIFFIICIFVFMLVLRKNNKEIYDIKNTNQITSTYQVRKPLVTQNKDQYLRVRPTFQEKEVSKRPKFKISSMIR